jgi:hypothetical protein
MNIIAVIQDTEEIKGFSPIRDAWPSNQPSERPGR